MSLFKGALFKGALFKGELFANEVQASPELPKGRSNPRKFPQRRHLWPNNSTRLAKWWPPGGGR